MQNKYIFNIFYKVKLDIKLILEIILQIVHNLTIKIKLRWIIIILYELESKIFFRRNKSYYKE